MFPNCGHGTIGMHPGTFIHCTWWCNHYWWGQSILVEISTKDRDPPHKKDVALQRRATATTKHYQWQAFKVNYTCYSICLIACTTKLFVQLHHYVQCPIFEPYSNKDDSSPKFVKVFLNWINMTACCSFIILRMVNCSVLSLNITEQPLSEKISYALM